MIICPVCGKELMDSAKFCAACGSPVSVKQTCAVCGQEIAEGAKFCGICGTPVPQQSGPIPTPPKPKKPFPKKVFLFAGIGVAAVAVLTVVVILVLNLLSGAGNKDSQFTMYLQDSEIFYSDLNKVEPIQVSHRLTNGEDVDNEELYDAAGQVGSYIAYTDNGKRLFYPDRIGDSEFGLTLYYRNINKTKEEPVKVDTDITVYAVNEDGTELFYVKGLDNTLYFNNFEEKIKIASYVSDFTVTEDLSKIGYLTDDNSYYIWYRDGSSVKIASDVTEIAYTDEALTEIWYVKDSTLYKLIEGEASKITVAENIYDVSAVYETGEAYYLREDHKVSSFMDFVIDDYAEHDAGITEPAYPDIPPAPVHPSYDQFNNAVLYEEAKKAFNLEYDAWYALSNSMIAEYEAAYAEYTAKVNRDYIRESLQNETLDMTRYALYYYDGEQEHLVTADIDYTWNCNTAFDTAIALVNTVPAINIDPVSIDSLEDPYIIYDMVYNATNGYAETYFVSGSTMTAMNLPTDTSAYLDYTGSFIYYVDMLDPTYESGDLYTISVKNGKLADPVLMDTDVYRYAVQFQDDNVLYFKNGNYDTMIGDLYMNGELVDYDAYFYPFVTDGAVYYFTDWNSTNDCGTLNVNKNGEKTVISDDVSDYVWIGADELLYMYDYSFDRYYGTLCHYANGESERVADDVVAIIQDSSYMIHGSFYW